MRTSLPFASRDRPGRRHRPGLPHCLRVARLSAPGLALLFVAGGASVVGAQEDWCEEGSWNDRPRACEVRVLTLSADPGRLEVNAHPNGGVSVEGWDRDEVVVRARVIGHAGDEARARDIVSRVEIETDGEVKASGPQSGREEYWVVSYRVSVPRRYALDLEAMNGGLAVTGVDGRMELRTVNGGISLQGVAGRVSGRTTNGGVTVRLSGARWEGEGLDVEATNGGITLHVPPDFSARLEAEVVNGGIDIDFPVTVQGRLGRRLSTDLGEGGAPIRLEATNGGIRIRRSGR